MNKTLIIILAALALLFVWKHKTGEKVTDQTGANTDPMNTGSGTGSGTNPTPTRPPWLPIPPLVEPLPETIATVEDEVKVNASDVLAQAETTYDKSAFSTRSFRRI